MTAPGAWTRPAHGARGRGLRLRTAAAWLLGAALACGGEAPAPEPALPAELAIEVETAPVVRGAIQPRISVPGSLVARRQSEIGAEVQGRIARVFVDVGDRVAEGEPLFRIDPERYQARLAQARAGADLARAERLQHEADLARARQLRSREVMAEQELERLRTRVDVALARERQARQEVALARQDLERTLVRAPYAASVAQRLADEGTTARTAPQTIVLVLQETAHLEARAALPETQLHLVRAGDPAELHVQGLAEPLRARLRTVGDTMDPQTRTFLVTMDVPNPDHRLKAGIFTHVEILPSAADDVLLVPREAVRSEDGESRVYVVREDRAVPVPVRLGLGSETAVEVLSGVEAGEHVIVGEAGRQVAPGMRVRVVQADDRGLSS